MAGLVKAAATRADDQVQSPGPTLERELLRVVLWLPYAPLCTPPQHKISKQKSNLRFLEKKNIPFSKGPQMRQDGLRVHHVIKEVRKDMPHNRRPGPGSAKKILIIHVFIYI